MGRKAGALGTIIGTVLLVIVIASFIVYHDRAEQRTLNMQMVREDCFPVDATWIEEKKDYDKNPTKWDCSRDILGNPKSSYSEVPEK